MYVLYLAGDGQVAGGTGADVAGGDAEDETGVEVGFAGLPADEPIDPGQAGFASGNYEYAIGAGGKGFLGVVPVVG